MKKMSLFGLLVFINLLLFGEAIIINRQIVEIEANQVGWNKWTLTEETDAWGDVVGTSELQQFVKGVYHDAGRAEDCILIFCPYPKDVEIEANQNEILLVAVVFDYYSPIAHSAVKKISVRKKNEYRTVTGSNSEKRSIISLSTISSGFSCPNFQYIFQNSKDKDEAYKALLCDDDEYLEMLIEGDGWRINTRLYGKSPV